MADEIDDVDVDEPLTKARLFTSVGATQEWSDMGVGAVALNTSPDDGSSSPVLLIRDVDDAQQLLLSTPMSYEDIYVVQNDAILVWADPHLGCDIACSFIFKEGCTSIVEAIRAAQRQSSTSWMNANNNVAGVAPGDVGASQWEVKTENLSAILDAATNTPLRFGDFIKQRTSFFGELAALFVSARDAQDVQSLDCIAAIVLILLRSPYNTEGKIMAQFVDNTSIDACIDIVQHGVGRTDAASGFVSAAERRATFKNPCALPAEMESRIHVLYACGYLKDLLPLSLDDGDAMASSLLTSFLVRFKIDLIDDMCSDEHLLRDAFQRVMSGPSTTAAEVADVAALVADIAKTIKHAAIPFDMKEKMMNALQHTGVFSFVSFAIARGLAAEPTDAHVATWRSAVEVCCDVLNSIFIICPGAKEELLVESASTPRTCILTHLLHGLTVLGRSSQLQSCFDAMSGCCVSGVIAALGYGTIAPQIAAARLGILQFFVDGWVVEKPPLYRLATHVAELLQSGESSPSMLSSSESLQVMYGLRALSLVVEEAPPHISRGVAEIIQLSNLLEACATALAHEGRRWANTQSSALNFVASLIENEDLHMMGAISASGLLSTIVELHLRHHRRQNLLSGAAGSVLDRLCSGVHREKLQHNSQSSMNNHNPLMTLVHGDDSSSLVHGGGANANAGNATTASQHTAYFDAAVEVMGRHGAELAARFPSLAEKLQRMLRETPEEAQMLDAETSSIASTMERSVSGISEFDALAMELGIDMATGSRSGSTSPSAGPSSAPTDRRPSLRLADDEDLPLAAAAVGDDDVPHEHGGGVDNPKRQRHEHAESEEEMEAKRGRSEGSEQSAATEPN